MKQYLIQERTIELPANSKVELTREQASVRLHRTVERVLGDHGSDKKPKRAIYTLAELTPFKAGEIIGWDGEVPKPLASFMVDPNETATADAEAAAAAERDREIGARAVAQHRTLVSAIRNVRGGDDGTVDVADIEVALQDANLGFEPSDAELDVAWQVVLEERLIIVEGDRQVAARAVAQHEALLAAIRSVQGKDEYNVSASNINAAIEKANLDFEPDPAQREAAWRALIVERAAAKA